MRQYCEVCELSFVTQCLYMREQIDDYHQQKKGEYMKTPTEYEENQAKLKRFVLKVTGKQEKRPVEILSETHLLIMNNRNNGNCIVCNKPGHSYPNGYHGNKDHKILKRKSTQDYFVVHYNCIKRGISLYLKPYNTDNLPKNKMKKRKLKISWSCGVKPFCTHKTRLGAWLHIWWAKLTK